MARIDVYPQWLNLTRVVEAAAGTFAQSETALPVRIESRQVMEVLGVEWKLGGAGSSAVTADLNAALSAQVTRRTQTGIITLNNPDTVDQVGKFMQQNFTTSGIGSDYTPLVYWHDFGSSGKGFLIATQSLFLGIFGNAAITAGQLDCRLLYKLVEVSAEELIGLVQQ